MTELESEVKDRAYWDERSSRDSLLSLRCMF